MTIDTTTPDGAPLLSDEAPREDPGFPEVAPLDLVGSGEVSEDGTFGIVLACGTAVLTASFEEGDFDKLHTMLTAFVDVVPGILERIIEVREEAIEAERG